MSFYPAFPSPEIIQSLNQLQSDTPALWGKMNAQQMLEHVQLVIEVSMGIITIPFPEELAKTDRVKQLFLMSDQPLRRNFKAPFIGEEPAAYRFSDLEEAKLRFIECMQAFDRYYTEKPDARHVHPVFGILNESEWRVFHRKHITHHFSQFGLINA